MKIEEKNPLPSGRGGVKIPYRKETVNSWIGVDVLFEYESGYLKRDIEHALLSGVDLRGADLNAS